MWYGFGNSSLFFVVDGTIDTSWQFREGRRKRYEGKRLGGTIVVHYIKKNMWFLETAMAFLEGDDVTDAERSQTDLPEATKQRKTLLATDNLMRAYAHDQPLARAIYQQPEDSWS